MIIFYTFIISNIRKYVNIHDVYVKTSSSAQFIILNVSLNLLSVELEPKTII